MQHPTLAQLLGIQPGITALVGAGGKTTAMLTLAQELAAQGQRVIITTTTHIFPPDCGLYGPVHQPGDLGGIARQLEARGLAVVSGPLDHRGKLTATTPQELARLPQLADVVLAEADGSRMLPCKVPGSQEPVLPEGTVQVVGLVGLSCLGKPLEEVCFRSQLACQQLNITPQQPLNPGQLARMITSPWGLAKATQGRRFSVVLNQRDACPSQMIKELVQAIHSGSSAQVVLAALKHKQWKEV